MDIIFGIAGSAIIAFILAILNSLLGKSKSTFMQSFTGIFFALVVIVVLGSILEMSGCNPEDEPSYPMKYSK